MNKLRILPLTFVCGFLRSAHKEPRATKLMKWLITLLLFWPALASAACLPSRVCWVTSGTAVLPGPCPPGKFFLCAPFNFAGKDFSASGVLDATAGLLPYGLLFNFESDDFFESFGGTVTENLLAQFELTVKGVPWGIPAGGDAGFGFFADLGIPAPAGTWSVPFSFEGFFKGAREAFSPGLGCDVLNCVNLEFRGYGIVTYYVQELYPGQYGVGAQTFEFRVVPEPTTLSLFALGLVGLAMRRKAVTALHTS